MAELKGNKYGTHRVIEPKGVLTQAAWKVDNDMSKVYSNEIVCDVTSLNIDSASFTQIAEACGGDEKKIGEMILGIVAERGKQQNPVTGSGGMFKGVVSHIGEDLKKKPGFDLKEGDKITTIGGIIGDVVSVKDDSIVIETSDDRVRMELTKWAVSQVGVQTGEQPEAEKKEKKAEKKAAKKAEKKSVKKAETAAQASAPAAK